MSVIAGQVNPSLLALLAEGFCSRLSSGVVSFALPLFAFRRLGLSLTQIGFIFSLNLIVEQMFKPVMGRLADHIGLKRSFTAASAVRSLVALLLAFAHAPWQVYAVRVVHGLSEALRDPTVSALIAENAPQEKTASTFAWYNTAKMSASFIGKAASGLLLAFFLDNYTAVFLVAFVLSGLPLFVVARYVREPRIVQHESEAANEENGDNGRQPLLPAAILGFLISSTAMMVAQLFPVLATEHAHLTEAQTGAIYLISVLVVIVSGPLFGWLSDHVSRKLVLTVRGVANICSSFFFFFFPSFAGMLVGNVTDAAGKAAFRPAWGALMAQISSFDRKRRARTMSYLSLGEGLGETVGPLLGGFLWSHFGLAAMLGVRVGLALIGEIYAWVVASDLRPEKSGE